jgi:hypothetical protein
MTHSTEQTVLFPALVFKPIHIAFDESHDTSDGGAVLLKAVDEQLGLTRALARCLGDHREPGEVRHQMIDLVRQRIFGVACGYEDANDVARVGADPMQKLLLDRDPIDTATISPPNRRSAASRIGHARSNSAVSATP